MNIFTRIILLFFAIFCVGETHAQLTANFTADVTAACSPLVVHFTNTTTPMSGTTFTWNLGLGGSPVYTTNASSSYITPGTYTITLTATNGSSSSTHSMTVTVYPSPVVSFIASDTAVCPGSPVTFTSTTSPGVPGPVSYTWSFGDGGIGTGGTITHTYTTPGYFNVKLAATNNDGCQSTLTLIDYIHVYTPPVAAFNANQSYCQAPATVTFNNTSSGTGPLTYQWSFGDGGTSTSASPTHTYSSPGAYTVSLVVTDGHGCTDTLTMSSYIFVNNGHAAFAAPVTACIGSTVVFPDSSSSHTAAIWDYGDGNSSAGDPGFNTYAAAGTYTVTLIVYDGHCYDTARHSVIVLPGPTASFTQSPADPCPPFNITLTATAPPGTNITWIYGDHSAPGSGTITSHTYGWHGVDTIQMVVRDPTTGCSDTVKRIDVFYDLELSMSVTPISGCAPLTVSFSAHPITYEPDTAGGPYPYPFPVVSWLWNFADGTTSTAATPTHTYTAVGTYNVVVTATTANGCIVTDTFAVHVGKPPIVTFTASPLVECFHNNNISFTTTVISGPVDEWHWQFGDGGLTTVSGPVGNTSHSYGIPGFFTATVTPYFNGCPGPPVTLSGIVIDSPMSRPWDSILCYPANTVMFADSSYGDDSHLWMFGDGTTSTAADPLHTYPAMGVYTVELATYNARSGCRDTGYGTVDLRRPVPTFSTPDTAFCKDTFAVFTPSYTGGGSIGHYHWESWGHSHDSDTIIYVDTFHIPGIYPITMITTDQNGCKDTVVKQHYILVAQPVAAFTIHPVTGCVPLTVTFTDNSTDVPGTSIVSHYWTFGDGTRTTVGTSTVFHTYYSPGNFTDTEIVTDNIGCKDSTWQSLVTAYQPVAAFTASNTSPCPNDTVIFTNTSSGYVSCFWTFGDGSSSTAANPTHVYTATGSYTVQLVVTDMHGCTDTATRPAYINVATPLAAFHMNDSLTICPPINVNFINTSAGATNYAWSFGDGGTSTLLSPSDLYLTPGYYTVKLIVTNASGCVDSTFGHVTVFGYAGAFSYGPSDSGCAPLTVHFTATTSNVPNIIWDFADGSVSHVSFTDTISHTYTVPGAYVPKLILSDNSGCQNSSIGADTIKIDGIATNFGPIPNPVCIGDTFLLIDSSKSYWSVVMTHLWHMHGITTVVDSPSFYIDSIGTFPATLKVMDGWGCVDSIMKTVTIVPLPIITASHDTTVCVGDAAVLTGYGGVSYAWQPLTGLTCTTCNPAHASPTEVTTYTVTGTDANHCSNTDTVSVLLRTLTTSKAWGDTTICFGQFVPLFDTGGTKYTWLPAGGLSNTSESTTTASPPSTYRYMAIAQLADCIPDTNYVTVTVEQLPTVNAGPDQTIPAGTTAQLRATGSNIATLLWNNAQTLSCSNCYTPVASMSVTTTYVITVTSPYGCKATDSVTINLYCDNGQLFMPNAFTPNHDGQDDVFYPRGSGVQEVKTFRIYNRWGEMLFERSNFQLNDPAYGWDGTFQGNVPHPDVYVWLLEATCESGQPLFLKGDITIIR